MPLETSAAAIRHRPRANEGPEGLGKSPPPLAKMISPAGVVTFVSVYRFYALWVAPADDNSLQLAKLKGLQHKRPFQYDERTLHLWIADDVTGHEHRVLRDSRPTHVDQFEQIEAALAAQPDVDEYAVDAVVFQHCTRFVNRTGGKHSVAAAYQP